MQKRRLFLIKRDKLSDYKKLGYKQFKNNTMGYYHIIYNSSQKGINGGAGFGFRTYTKGTPQEYLEALQENDLVGYKQGGCEQIMPKALIDNPEIVKKLPSGYFFGKLPIVGGMQVYVIGRTIPVGFDYTYYNKFTAGRLGNYLMDCYLFEEAPSQEVLQILYENPANGSNSFIPKDPCPRPENEEMKTLSLGQMEALSVEDKPFKAAELQPISKEAIWALFSLIEARKNQKVLVISSEWKNAAKLMGDLYRLIPNDIIGNFSFFSNYQDEGLLPGYEILLVNEFYNYSFSDNAVVKLNLIDGKFNSTQEWETFGRDLTNDLEAGNMKAVYDRVKWLLSDAYYKVKDKSAATNQAFYQYCIVPEDFKLESLNGNEELVSLLAEYVRKDNKHSEPFASRVNELLKSSANIKSATDAIEKIENLKTAGFELVNGIADKYKKHLSEIFTKDAASLVNAIGLTNGNLDVLSRYFDKGVFESKNELLDESTLVKYWSALYSYFYKKEQLEGGKRESVLTRMVSDKVSDEDKLSVLAELYSTKEDRVVIDIIKKQISTTPDNVKAYWPLLDKYLSNNPKDSSDLIAKFSNQLANTDFAPLFYKCLVQNGIDEDPVKAIEILKNYIVCNDSLKKLIVNGFDSDSKLYPTLFSDIKERARESEEQAESIAESVKTNVLDVFMPKITTDWRNLYILLKGDAAAVKKDNLSEILSLADNIKNGTYFEKLVDKFISLAEDGNVKVVVAGFDKLLKWGLNRQLQKIRETDPKKISNAKQFYKEILEQNNVSVKEAVDLVSEKKIVLEGSEDSFLEDCYGDKYKRYKMKAFINKLLKKPFFWGGSVIVLLLLGGGIFYVTQYGFTTDKKEGANVPVVDGKNEKAVNEKVSVTDSLHKQDSNQKDSASVK